METTKKPALLALARVLHAADVPYAIIGGIAVQVHHPEPRTTLDIDVAVASRNAIPHDALFAAGFRRTGSFEHSENWMAEDGTPVQFADDPALASAVTAAEEVAIDDVTLRVIRAVDLLHEKIRAGTDPARRRSKRLQDLGDAHALIEAQPRLKNELSPEEAAVLDRLPL
ncbi:MAG TPA: nucleotidyl transferase AbiEii/AbiGii toxin family protein [Thermoanaerobaculia bacterium]